MQALTHEQLKSIQGGFRKNAAVANALAKNEVFSVVVNGDALSKSLYSFSNEIKTSKVTNQKASGRCWIFAGLNVLRESIAKELKLEDFELSQNFVAFYDKLEKINYFLESILDTLHEDVHSRLVDWILQTGIVDGGQWDMLVNVLEKYGAVPKDAMQETYLSSHTGSMNKIINIKLRKNAAVLRGLHGQGVPMQEIRAEKDRMLQDLYGVLRLCFGTPPEEFVWEYKDKDGSFTRAGTMTPKAFYEKYVGGVLKDYVSVINAPTDDKPFGKSFTVRFLGNVAGGNDILYLNTDIGTMKQIVLRQLLDGEVVWFGSDVGHGLDRDTGILDNSLYDLDSAFGMDFSLSKKDRLDYRASAMNHAMVITAANVADGKPNRWKIENSWGDEKGDKGYYVMTDPWFDDYVYQAVVHQKYLTDELRAAMTQKPIVLDPWDPMGSLAK